MLFNDIKEKNRNLIFHTVSAFLIKGLALIVSLFAMPAYMNYFSEQKILGIWFTLLSVLTWILNFDLGIGNGLRNKLTFALTQKDYILSKKLISSAYWSIGIIVLIIMIIGLKCIPYIDWNTVFNIDSNIISSDSLNTVINYIFIGIMVQFLLKIISSILYSLQKSSLNNLIVLSTSLMQLIFALYAPVKTPVENLKLFSMAYAFSSNFPLIFATIYVFFGSLKNCRPNIKYVDIACIKSILSLGGLFFICQILYMIIANTNEFFITQYTDSSYVVEYQIYYKLFSLGSTMFMLALTPLWSAISKSLAQKDFIWLRKIYKVLLLLTILGILVEFSIIPFLQLIINIWLGENAIQVNYLYAFSFAFFGSMMIWQSSISTIVNGLSILKTQATCYLFAVICKFILIHIGIQISGNWIVVVLTNGLILMPYCIIQQIKIKKALKLG